MQYRYKTKGTCSVAISFEIEKGVVHDVTFTGGCDGNLKAISRLVEGQTAEEIARRIGGVTCGWKPTSCGDQLARAVLEAAEAEKNS